MDEKRVSKGNLSCCLRWLESVSVLCERFTSPLMLFWMKKKRKLLTPYRKPDRSTGLIVAYFYVIWSLDVEKSEQNTCKKSKVRSLFINFIHDMMTVKKMAAGTRDIEYKKMRYWRWRTPMLWDSRLFCSISIENLCSSPTQGYLRTIKSWSRSTIIIFKIFFIIFPFVIVAMNMLKCFHDFSLLSTRSCLSFFCLNSSNIFGDHRPIHPTPMYDDDGEEAKKWYSSAVIMTIIWDENTSTFPFTTIWNHIKKDSSWVLIRATNSFSSQQSANQRCGWGMEECKENKKKKRWNCNDKMKTTAETKK